MNYISVYYSFKQRKLDFLNRNRPIPREKADELKVRYRIRVKFHLDGAGWDFWISWLVNCLLPFLDLLWEIPETPLCQLKV